MAVQSDTSRIQYAGNNSTTTSYAVPFVFQENAHLKAIARTSAGVESVVTLTNHAGAGNVNGGTVRTAVAVPATSTLTIYREVPATQTTTYAEGGDFPAASHERALDKLTQIAQQLQRNVESSVRMTDALALDPLVVPTGSTPHVLTTVNGQPPTWEPVPPVPTEANTAFGLNHLWAGEMRCWPMGNAAAVSSVQRTHIPAGVTVARTGFATGVTVTHVNGDYSEDAIRIQRDATNTNTADAVLVFSLTQEETKPLAGNNVVLQWNGSKSATYTGGALTYKIQWSEEPQQPILNADGTYSNGNEIVASGTFALGTSARNPDAPFWATALIPADATQVSFVLSVPFVGTAGSDDYVDIESVSLVIGSQPARVLVEPTESIIAKGATRYQTSYPANFPRGTATRQGSVQAVAVNANTSYSFAIPVRFAPTMAIAPQFLFQSPTSGTESRLLNVTTDTTVNGLAFNISENGTTITNNGAITANDQVLCQWTANAQL